MTKEKQVHTKIVNASWFDTKLGQMIAISDEQGLYLLEFSDKQELNSEIEKLKAAIKATVIKGTANPIAFIKLELEAYFEGKLTDFKTPIHFLGTSFQQCVWQELMATPYGTIRTYKDQATSIGKATAFRAVANANGANQLAVIVPCHRIVNTNGKLGGYGAGIMRKKWLIDHEKQHV